MTSDTPSVRAFILQTDPSRWPWIYEEQKEAPLKLTRQFREEHCLPAVNELAFIRICSVDKPMRGIVACGRIASGLRKPTPSELEADRARWGPNVSKREKEYPKVVELADLVWLPPKQVIEDHEFNFDVERARHKTVIVLRGKEVEEFQRVWKQRLQPRSATDFGAMRT